MEREIKFRAKAKDTGEWVYGFPLRSDWSDEWYIFPAQGMTGSTGTIVERETLGQYTCLKDKKGKEIYEGDIVRFEECVADAMFKTYQVSVTYMNGSFQPVCDICGIGNTDDEFDTLMLDCDVIGNEIDNPYLLED